MSRIFADIDAAFAEEEFTRDPIPIKMAGHVWTFPGVMPATAVIRLSRWEAEGRGRSSVDGLDVGDLTTGEQIALIGDLVPDEVLRGWADMGIGLDDPRVEHLVVTLLTEYGRRMESGQSGKGPDVPAKATPPPYSGTGGSSLPTSDGSTASISPEI